MLLASETHILFIILPETANNRSIAFGKCQRMSHKPEPRQQAQKASLSSIFNNQVFVSDNRFEVRCMIFHVKMLFVGGGWLVRFSRAISVTVGASATNDRCEGTCKVDSRPASCFVLLCLFSISKRKVLLIPSMFE